MRIKSSDRGSGCQGGGGRFPAGRRLPTPLALPRLASARWRERARLAPGADAVAALLSRCPSEAGELAAARAGGSAAAPATALLARRRLRDLPRERLP
jgi:hypothetical protein